MKAEVKKQGGNAHAVVSLFLPASTSPFFSYLKNTSFKKNVKYAGNRFWQSTKGVLAVAAGAVLRESPE